MTHNDRKMPDGSADPAGGRTPLPTPPHDTAEIVSRPKFCNTWPWPNSDLDLVLPADNAAVHRARGCCDGAP